MHAERPRSRGPYAKTTARRAAILRAAREAFAENGYAASSLRDIAERAGLTHAGLQHHFTSKEALLVAMLAERDADEERLSRAPAEGSDARTSADVLTDLLRAHQATPDLTGLWAELAINARHADHPAHDYFVARYSDARTRVCQHLRSLARTGRLQPGLDPDAAAAVFIAVLDGLQTQWLLDQSVDISSPLLQFLRLLEPGSPSPRG